MTVEIHIIGENAAQALSELRGLTIGLEPPVRVGAEMVGHSETLVSGVSVPATDNQQQADTAPQRERGKPAPGKARRTKEEIAEDEAADAADAASEPAANISTGEDRIDPADAAQDAEDEAADEANAPAEDATREDVRAAMLAYQGAYGTPALMSDMTTILKEEYPAGDVTKLSEIPDTADDFAKIKGRLVTALADNTFERERVAA